MKKIIYFILLSFLITSCSNKNTDGQTDYKKEISSNLDNKEDIKVLEELRKHMDQGVYEYKTYDKVEKNIINKKIQAKSEKIEFLIINDNDYYFNDGNNITYANKEKNLYFQEKSNGIFEDNIDEQSYYEELFESGLKSIEINEDNIILHYKEDSFFKYDRKSLDLLEQEFVSGGKKVQEKLISKDIDVKSAYNKYIKVIDGMQEAKTAGEVTGNE
ncbi:MAG: hypothetical protein Q4A76_03910 [Porphyromonadaceae bacterium]|nr:hypothetical protein [Porphyromonadaceae bacterium]